ncbi:MAG: DASS family sodium-coupled anion symporter [Negativicutes bacterium]|nr:DASS family sodium-coupled anion symporter [Negativicutes bacterium]
MAERKLSYKPLLWMALSLVVMFGIAFMPPLPGLSVAGQRILAILAFAVIMWVTEAVPYTVSAVAIVVFITLFLGFAPEKGLTGPLLGTGKALPIAFGGFINGGLILVGAGLFMAAGVLHTGLDRRIALNILKLVGAKTNNIIAGMIIIMFVLDFFIPSMTARAATVVPLALGVLRVFDVDPRSVFGRNLLICVALSASISGIGILSAGVPNPIAVSFIQQTVNHSISWLEWAAYGMPLCALMLIALYFLITRLNKFEFEEVPGGQQCINQSCIDLGPMSPAEKRIGIIFAVTILLWSTDFIHRIDANSVAVVSVLLMLSPYIGIATFKEMSAKVDWGTLIICAVAISLGEALFKTGAALWLAKTMLGGLGLESLSPPVMMIILAGALLIFRFAFASIASATAALVPTVLGFLLSLNNPDLPIWGMTVLATFTVYFSFVLPVNAPQNMIPYATGTFEVRDMARIGIPMTLIGFALFTLFTFTYWRWLGLV